MKTITVGIPAFNEEANIGFILKDLLAQNTKDFKIEAIVVNSDGSRDRTVKEALKIKDKRIIVLDNKKRTGRVYRQNQIFKISDSDALVLIDADTQIKDKNFLKKITAPIFAERADLTSVKVQELAHTNLFGRSLKTSMKLKKQIFESINSGNNLYTCHGRARGFSKKLYKKIKFKDSINEDAFSYLYAITKGFKYKYVSSTEIFYQLPENIDDHQYQSIRYLKSKSLLNKYFGKEIVESNYRLPLVKSLIIASKYFIKNPIEVIIYLFVFASSILKSKSQRSENTWVISQSSKRLRKAAI